MEKYPLCVATITTGSYGLVFTNRQTDDAPKDFATLYAMDDGTVRWKLPEIPKESTDA